jgi:hypothetical protein
MRFLRDCIRRMTTIRFADHQTGRVLARLERGRLASLAPEAVDGGTIRRLLTDLRVPPAAGTIQDDGEVLSVAEARTLGAWGPSASPAVMLSRQS